MDHTGVVELVAERLVHAHEPVIVRAVPVRGEGIVHAVDQVPPLTGIDTIADRVEPNHVIEVSRDRVVGEEPLGQRHSRQVVQGVDVRAVRTVIVLGGIRVLGDVHAVISKIRKPVRDSLADSLIQALAIVLWRQLREAVREEFAGCLAAGAVLHDEVVKEVRAVPRQHRPQESEADARRPRDDHRVGRRRRDMAGLENNARLDDRPEVRVVPADGHKQRVDLPVADELVGALDLGRNALSGVGNAVEQQVGDPEVGSLVRVQQAGIGLGAGTREMHEGDRRVRVQLLQLQRGLRDARPRRAVAPAVLPGGAQRVLEVEELSRCQGQVRFSESEGSLGHAQRCLRHLDAVVECLAEKTECVLEAYECGVGERNGTVDDVYSKGAPRVIQPIVVGVTPAAGDRDSGHRFDRVAVVGVQSSEIEPSCVVVGLRIRRRLLSLLEVVEDPQRDRPVRIALT